MGQVTAANGGSMRLALHDPGMSALHRAGLAGLWMTLESMEQDPVLMTEFTGLGVSWQRSETGLELSWTGNGKALFAKLIEASFRLTDDGRFWFFALGHPNNHEDRGTTLQDALLATFLQHGRTRAAEPAPKASGSLVVSIETGQEVLGYRRVTSYNHQQTAEKFSSSRLADVAGWQFPGGVVRHVAFAASTSLKEPPERSLALLFAPVGAFYFRIRRRSGGVRPQYCIAIPDVQSLADFSAGRRYFLTQPAQEFVVAGTADAGTRVLARLAARGLLSGSGVTTCVVVTFGVAPWATQQKTRMDVFEVRVADSRLLTLYSMAQLLLPALRRQTKTGQPYWETSPVLDLLARNIVSNQPWWRGFAAIQSDKGLRSQFRSHEAGLREARPGQLTGVAALVNEPGVLEDNAAMSLVEACHQAWNRRLGAMGQRSRERGESFRDLVRRERERLRVSFSHCKNAATFRAAITDFWSRSGGALPALQGGWPSILPFLGDQRWEEGRDLALLALVSYRGDGAVENDDGDAESNDEKEALE